jgi:hypothetical protein
MEDLAHRLVKREEEFATVTADAVMLKANLRTAESRYSRPTFSMLSMLTLSGLLIWNEILRMMTLSCSYWRQLKMNAKRQRQSACRKIRCIAYFLNALNLQE